MEAHLDWVVLTECELESVRFACVDRIRVKHLDVQKPVLKVVCLYERYPGRKLTLHLKQTISTSCDMAIQVWESENHRVEAEVGIPS